MTDKGDTMEKENRISLLNKRMNVLDRAISSFKNLSYTTINESEFEADSAKIFRDAADKEV